MKIVFAIVLLFISNFANAQGGRLTLSPGQPIMTSDISSTTLYYAPYTSDGYLILNSSLNWVMLLFSSGPTDQIGASMSGGSKWAAGTSRDIFGTFTGAICSGPAWSSSDLPSRSLTRYNGVMVNAATLTCDTSASVSVPCPQYQCTYLGSITNSITGQLEADFSYGQTRKFEVWNAYNQIDNILQVGVVLPSSYKPQNIWPNFQPFNNDANNRANVFTGLLTVVDVTYHQNMYTNAQMSPSALASVVLWDGTDLGSTCLNSSDLASVLGAHSCVAHYFNAGVLGSHTATMGVAAANSPTSSMYAGNGAANGVPVPPYSAESNLIMYVRFKG